MTDSNQRRSVSSSRKRPLLGFGSRTDIGCVRKHNEDSLVVSPPLYAVADGMGGHAAGEVASEIAVNTLIEHAPSSIDAEALSNAVMSANREVIAASQDGRGREGMGTTMTAAMLEGERLVIAQVGDSRAYLLHKDELQQLTRDHSLMADMIEAGQLTEEEARTHPNRSVITRALGSDINMQADLYEINVETGDRLLLCSDGLSTMITNDEIKDVLMRIGDAQRCANMLVNKAISAGGHDNITVVVVDVDGFSAIKEKKSARKVKTWAIMLILAFLLIIGGTAAGFNYYLNNTFYLVNEEGNVAIYRGLPGVIFGIDASELEQVTDIAVDSLQPGVANRLEEGIRVDSMAAAESLIDEYRKESEKKATPGSNATETSGEASPSGNNPSSSSEDSPKPNPASISGGEN